MTENNVTELKANAKHECRQDKDKLKKKEKNSKQTEKQEKHKSCTD